jgi:arylsulfatase A-like enzyme
MKNYRIVFYFLIILGGILVSCQGKRADENDKASLNNRPNFLILFIDDLGYNDLGFRDQKFHTPAIDQLAKESLEFKYAYVPSPTCSPSRSALYTGKHAARLQIYRHIPHNPEGEFHTYPVDPSGLLSRNWLLSEEVTYAEALEKLGYNTFLAGKWHLGEKEHGPETQGFHKYVAGGVGSGLTKKHMPVTDDGKTVEKYVTDILTDSVVDYILTYNEDKPFLIQFSYWNVHSPTVGRNDLVEFYNDLGLQGKEAEYAAQVTSVDESIEKVLNALQEKGLEKNTVIFFASDQGSLFPNTPLRGGKPIAQALYEGSARVPFLVKWPGIAKAGINEEEHVSTLDIFPTMLDICGEDPVGNYDLDGLSLVDLIKENKPLKREHLFFYRSYDAQYASVLAEDGWKLIAYRDNRFELFNIYEDVSEENDLSQDNPEMVDKLVEALRSWEESLGLLIED